MLLRKPVVSLYFIVGILLLSRQAQAQLLQKELLVTYIYDLAFRGDDLWEATDRRLIRRDLTSGVEEAAFELPPGANGFQGIAVDPQGHLWLTLGTGGVAFFDGDGFWKIWNAQNTPVFASNLIFSGVGIDPKTEQVWVSTYSFSDSSRYYVYDGSTWREDATLKGFFFSGFAGGPGGQFVFCALDTLLQRENGRWIPLTEPKEGAYNYLGAPVFDPQGQLWLTSQSSELYRYGDLKAVPQRITSTGSKRVRNMVFDASGNLYAAINGAGLGKWNGSQWTYFNTVAGSTDKFEVWKIRIDPAGKLWIAQELDYGSAVLTMWANGAPQKNFFHQLPETSLLGQDGAGNAWFGGHASVFTRKNARTGAVDYFELFGYGKELFFVPGTQLRPGRDKEVWCRGRNKLFHFDGGTWLEFPQTEMPDLLHVFCADQTGRLYLSGASAPDFDLRLRYLDLDTHTWTPVHLPALGDAEPSYIDDLTTDADNNLWFVSDKGLGKRNYNGSVIESYPLPPNISMERPRIAAGPGNLIYLMASEYSSFNVAPMLQFDANAKTWQTIPLPPLEWRLAKDIQWHVDLYGRVWLGVNITIDLTTTSIWLLDNGVWTEIKGLPNNINGITSDAKGNVYLGFYGLLGIFKSAGSVTGVVRRDMDQNCLVTPGDQPLPNMLVVATDGTNQFLSVSQADGTYRLYSGADRVSVGAQVPNALWRACTPASSTLQLTPDQPAVLDLLVQAAVDCPHLSVDLSTPFLRRCFDNVYSARICNDGTAVATAPYADFVLPPEMEIVASGHPYTQIAPRHYRFALPDLATGDCFDVRFTAHVGCDNTSIGQTLCVSARVYPDMICVPSSGAWKGATLSLDAACQGDSVLFTVKNTGIAPTARPLTYEVFRNDVPEYKGTFNLTAGETRPILLPADGATWRLSATQEPGHPFLPRTPSLAVEACGAPLSVVNRGFVNSRPNSSGSGFEDYDCRELIGSYDPNDKTAAPAGVGATAHMIPPATPIEYHIRFQNTGTDTAFTVVVRDTLSRLFDLRTFEPGAASHPYRLDIRGNALSFVFEHILLPDSNANLAASQGFVNFRIRPRRDLPLGSRIANCAAIYFDFNDPVPTNIAWHLVDSIFQTTALFSIPSSSGKLQQLALTPNPADQSLWVGMEKAPAHSFRWMIMDAHGNTVMEGRQAEKLFRIDVSNLPAGIYIMALPGQPVAPCKFVVVR